MENKKSKFEADGGDEVFSEFVKAAREYYLNDFPKPNRRDCPPSVALSEIARSGKVPDDELRRHLLCCSPCLKEFQARRKSEIVPVIADEKVSWFDFFRKPIFAVALCLLILGLSGALVYILFTPKNEEIAGLNKSFEPNINSEIVESNTVKLPENVEIPVNVNKTVRKTADTNQPIKKETPEKIEKPKTRTAKTFNFDVSKAAVLRGNNGRQTIYSLPDGKINLNIKLVGNSPAGDYQISLFDAFKKPLIENRIIYSDGKLLKTRIDLTNQNGKARLCVAPVGEVPDCFLVDIVNEK